jgi:L-amino acid N-acyltransferase YncA
MAFSGMEIRLATRADARGVQAVYAPVVASTPISFELVPPSVEEMGARIADVLPTHPWIVLTEGGEPASAGRSTVRCSSS